jgi:hypothetical protein
MKTLARPQDKAEIASRLAMLRADSARRWGRMSAHQAVCHLSDSFRAVIGRRPVRLQVSFLQRTFVKWFALHVPLRWPAGVPTTPELDQLCGGGTSPAEFAADVADLAALVELVTAEPRTFEWQQHPTFGPMTNAEWLRWGYLHMDHHLRQFGA